MFNSSLINISIELNNGMYHYDQPLVNACREFHVEIIRTELEMWNDEGGSDEAFIERFADDFPPGFMRRDLQRAKNILYDLYDIAISDTPRLQLIPIYTFVMYRLIEDWFIVWEDLDETIVVPRGLKTYLRKMHASKCDFETVVSWFANGKYCVNDFAETYNGDYVSIDFAEEIAGMYLYDEYGGVKLTILGVTIDEFFDLLPNDLRTRCIEKYERQIAKNGTILMEIDNKKPVVFISYSWDSDAHKKWVRELSDKLADNGIQTILDQKDLVLGDPLTRFMEQSIINSDYVLIVCTPMYKQKADTRKGGVGYEESIITGDVFSNQNHRKYITVLASGTWPESTPVWAGGKYGVDLSAYPYIEEEFGKLINTVMKISRCSSNLK